MGVPRFSRLHSIPVRILAGFAAMLLLQVAVAGAVWWAEGRAELAAAAEQVAEARSGQVRAASAKLADVQRLLAEFLRSGGARERDAVQAALAAFQELAKPLAGDEAGAALGIEAAAMGEALSGVVAGAAGRRDTAANMLEMLKQTQNAFTALAAAAPRLTERASVDAIAAASAAALRPFSAVPAYLASEDPGDAEKISSGLGELRSALAGVVASAGDSQARLQRLVGAVDVRLGGLTPALEELNKSIAARSSSLAGMAGLVRRADETMRGIAKRIGAEREMKRTEMRAARALLPRTLGWAVGLGCVLGGAFATLVGMSITRPVQRLATAMRALAVGALDTAVPDRTRRDEIGGMAAAVQVFKENMVRTREMSAEQEQAKAETALERRATLERLADAFEEKVGEMVGALAAGSGALEETAQTMSGAAAQTGRQATEVSDAADQASAGVQTAAAAAEQLSASIGEINRHMVRSSQVTGEVVTLARQTDRVVRDLASGAEAIGQVVGLISDIAGRTNLLALNATIEAARAGSAGKGFAVVAAEVKTLATQTAKATDDVSKQIEEIQATTRQAVAAIGGIATAIDEAAAIASAVAAAVEQQGAATAEISRTVQQTASATQAMTVTIGGVKDVAGVTGLAAEKVLRAAGDVSGQARRLSVQVGGFVAEVRAA